MYCSFVRWWRHQNEIMRWGDVEARLSSSGEREKKGDLGIVVSGAMNNGGPSTRNSRKKKRSVFTHATRAP